MKKIALVLLLLFTLCGCSADSVQKKHNDNNIPTTVEQNSEQSDAYSQSQDSQDADQNFDKSENEWLSPDSENSY